MIFSNNKVFMNLWSLEVREILLFKSLAIYLKIFIFKNYLVKYKIINCNKLKNTIKIKIWKETLLIFGHFKKLFCNWKSNDEDLLVIYEKRNIIRIRTFY